tara:strand:- start:533 stop:646 length:114 start_codon:yes stop_codon:yes gene_type:complete
MGELNAIIKEKLNHKKVNLKNQKKEEIYRIPLRINVK